MRPHTILTFMVVVHTLAMGAGSAGFIDQQENDNPHREFVQDFRGNASSQISGVDSGATSGIVDTFTVSLKSLPILGFVYQFLASPYTILIGSGLPAFLKTLIGGVMAVGSITAAFSMARGGIY